MHFSSEETQHESRHRDYHPRHLQLKVESSAVAWQQEVSQLSLAEAGGLEIGNPGSMTDDADWSLQRRHRDLYVGCSSGLAWD